MNTEDIKIILRNVNSFGGVYSRDTLPPTSVRPISFVVNTDSCKEPGEHWNAILLLPNGFGEFFNSFGFPPLHPLEQMYMMKQCPNGFKSHSKTLQHPESDVCGLYCIDYIKSRARGTTLRKYLSCFSRDLKANDKLVVQRVTSKNDC